MLRSRPGSTRATPPVASLVPPHPPSRLPFFTARDKKERTHPFSHNFISSCLGFSLNKSLAKLDDFRLGSWFRRCRCRFHRQVANRWPLLQCDFHDEIAIAVIDLIPIFFHSDGFCTVLKRWILRHVQCFGVGRWIRHKDHTLASAFEESHWRSLRWLLQ